MTTVLKLSVIAFGVALLSCFAESAPSDLDLRAWRIETKGVSVKAKPGFAGKAPVFCVDYAATGGTARAEVSFSAKEGLRRHLDSWIPPYVGAHARTVSLSVMPYAASGDVRVNLIAPIYAPGRKGENRKLAIGFGGAAGEWNDLSVDVGRDEDSFLGGLRLEIEGTPGSTCRFVFADLRIALDDGRLYEVLNADAPHYTAMMPAPMRTRPVRDLPKRPTIKFGMISGWLFGARGDLSAIGEYMRKYLPEYDFVMSMAWTPSPAIAKLMEDAPENIYFQFQGGDHDLRYAGLKDALVKNRFGKSQSIRFNSVVATHPVLRDAFEDQVKYLGSLGFNSVQQYDYVWYYPKGYAGWDDATVAAFREDLTGRDEGLALAATTDGEPERTVRFWEWYRDYRGKTLEPSDLGFATWEAYRPSTDNERDSSVYFGLIAYEWLRQAQRFGRWTKSHCYGGTFDFLLNSEFYVANGNDHLYLARLKDVGDILPEFFDETPRELDMIYRSSALFLRNAKRYGKRWGVTLETSSGGGGNQPYWSPRTGYAVAYVLSALGYDAFEYDGAPCRASWADSIAPQHRWMLDLGMAEARAYRQAKLDGAHKPNAEVFHLTERPITKKFAQVFQPLDGGANGDLRGELTAAQLDYETTIPQDLPFVLGRAKAIAVAANFARPDLMDTLERWRKADPSRLILRTAEDVAAFAASSAAKRIQPAAATNTAYVLPFACRVGQVAAVFNRGAIAVTGPYEAFLKWCREVHDPVAYRQIFDADKYLHKDENPGLESVANLCVGRPGRYRVYRMLTDEETMVDAVDGVLKLPIGTAFCDVFYYGEDTESFRAFLKGVKADRALTADFFEPGH